MNKCRDYGCTKQCDHGIKYYVPDSLVFSPNHPILRHPPHRSTRSLCRFIKSCAISPAGELISRKAIGKKSANLIAKNTAAQN